MCGILGAIAIDGEPDYGLWSTWVERGLGAMIRRGPDAGDSFVENRVALGARRLRVHDLSPLADQPLRSSDGSALIVLNGAIFNYRRLRDELLARNHEFKTHGDTEVALAALREWGAGAFARLDGMFAIAFYDRATRRLLLGRDRLGIKPLFHTQLGNGEFLFSSEIKPLLAHPFTKRRVNRAVIPEYLAFQFVAPPNTLFEDIQVFPPGHYLEWQQGQTSVRPTRYWKLGASFVAEAVSRKVGVEEALESSLRECWDADRPVGIQLSGGVDSSLVAAVSRNVLGAPTDAMTYSVIFDDRQIEYYKPRSEEAFVQRALEHYPYRNRSYTYDCDEVRRALPEAIWFHEQPLMGASTCLYMLLARSINREVTVLLTGEGADDIFLGYFYNWTFGNDPSTQFQYFIQPSVLDQLVGSGGAASVIARRKEALSDPEVAACTPAQRASILTIETVLHGLLARHDRMFMSHSIEGRPPFCSEAMLLARFGLPDEAVADERQGKLPLKRMAASIFGHDFAYRQKIGFSAPFGDWCAKPAWWRGYVDRMDDELLGQFVNPQFLREWRRQPDSVPKFSGVSLNTVFALTQLQLWYEIFFSSADPSKAEAWESRLI